MWVKLLEEYTQKALKKGDDPIAFKKDQIIEIEDDDLAKSLIKLGHCEESKKPEGDMDFDGLEKSLTSLVEKTFETSFKKSLAGFTDKLEKNIPIIHIHDDKQEDYRGFKDEGHFLKCVMESSRAARQGVTPDAALVGGQEYIDLLIKAPSGQNVSNDSEGGFMVVDSMSNRIWDNMENNPASFLPRTDRFETGGNSLPVPKMQETSRKAGAGQRHAGIQVGWLDEAGLFSSTKAKVEKDRLELHKLGAVVYFSEEQLEDAPSTWNRRVQRLVPEAIMFEANYSFLHGTGVAQPKGIRREDSAIVIPSGDRAGAAQTNHTILHWNLSQMYWRNWNRDNAIWVVHPDTAQQLEFVLFDDNATVGVPIYTPINRGLVQPGSVIFVGPYGLPMLVHEMALDNGNTGDIGLYDFSQYATLTKVGGGVKTASSIHVRFLYEETAFRFSFRLGGKSFWTAPKEDLHGDTTRSPFTLMASRTGGSTSSGL